MIILCHELSFLFGSFINTTGYPLGLYDPSSTSTRELHAIMQDPPLCYLLAFISITWNFAAGAGCWGPAALPSRTTRSSREGRRRPRRPSSRRCGCRNLGKLEIEKLGKLFNPKMLLWSPGLVVMGGDSCPEGCGFESQHHILDGHFFTLFVVKIVMFVWKYKNKWKRDWDWSIF